MTPVPHPPYSPNLYLSDFFVAIVSLDKKKVFKGKCFANVEEVKQEMAEVLKIKKFQNCFEQQKKGLDRCIASNGDHFEDDQSLNM